MLRYWTKVVLVGLVQACSSGGALSENISQDSLNIDSLISNHEKLLETREQILRYLIYKWFLYGSSLF